LLINGRRVKRVISKGKPIFVIVMVEYALDSYPVAFHPLVQPLLQEFEDIFP